MAVGKGKAAPRKKSAALRYRRIVPPSLARVRAYHPKPADRYVLRRRLFPPRATLGQKFAKAGHLRKHPGRTRSRMQLDTRSITHDAVIRVYEEAGNVIRVHEEAHSSRAAVYK